MPAISSINNRRVADAVRLKKRAMRDHDRRFLLEGRQGVAEALAAGAAVHAVFLTVSDDALDVSLRELAAESGVPVFEVTEAVMSHLTSTVTPQGVVAVADFVDGPIETIDLDRGVVPVLVEVRDPGNAGTILRSADAAGAAGVVVTRASVDVYNPKTVRATAGSLFHLPVARDVGVEEAIESLRGRGATIVAASADGERSVYDAPLAGPVAVLFGNEAHGLAAPIRDVADLTVRVPIAGAAESLNLAAAATVILFEAARRRADEDALARVVAGAAHDIRSPLTALKGFGSTLLSRWGRLDDEQRLAMLEAIVHDGARMEVIVSQLVDAARVTSGRLELAPVPLELLGAVRRIAEEIDANRLTEAGVEVSGDPATVEVDATRLRTIVLSLVEAAAWWGEQGPVFIGVEAEPVVRLVVRRSGTSLDDESAASLLRPRAPGTGGGSKVGLFVAARLAEAHAATLSATGGEAIRLTLTFARSAAR